MRFFTSPSSLTSVLHKNRFALVAFDRLDCFRSGRIDIADHNLRAASRKKLRRRATNPSSSASDKRDLA